MAKERPQCKGVSSASGTRCLKDPIKGTDYCIYHDPNVSDERRCRATNKTDGEPCRKMALPGVNVCEFHAGRTPVTVRAARQRLANLVPKALEALEKAMEFGDWPTVVRAAQVILDRAGMGPNATLTIEEKTKDLSQLTTEELEYRARRVFEALQAAKREAEAAEAQDGEVVEHDGVPLLPSGQGDEAHVS